MTAGDEAWDWHSRQDRRVPDSPQRDALLTDALSARADPTLLDAVATTNVTALLRVARSVKKAHPLLAQALTGVSFGVLLVHATQRIAVPTLR